MVAGTVDTSSIRMVEGNVLSILAKSGFIFNDQIRCESEKAAKAKKRRKSQE